MQLLLMKCATKCDNRKLGCLMEKDVLYIVSLTQVWQSLFPFFCDKTFEFAIPTWQTS